MINCLYCYARHQGWGCSWAPGTATLSHTHTYKNVQFINNRNTNRSNRTELSLDLRTYSPNLDMGGLYLGPVVDTCRVRRHRNKGLGKLHCKKISFYLEFCFILA